MKKHSLKGSILYIIKSHKKENAIKSKKLRETLGCDGRIIRTLIHELRVEDNIPICSGNNGYFYPDDISEARHSVNRLRSSARELYDAAEGIEKAFEKDKQLSIV